MTLEQCITKSREKKLVEPDKFDNHMSHARLADIESRKLVFRQQSEGREKVELKPSVY